MSLTNAATTAAGYKHTPELIQRLDELCFSLGDTIGELDQLLSDADEVATELQRRREAKRQRDERHNRKRRRPRLGVDSPELLDAVRSAVTAS